MKVELSDTDTLFIYITFKKELDKIDEIASAKNCPLSKSSIRDAKAPYLSVVQKLLEQCPNLKNLHI